MLNIYLCGAILVTAAAMMFPAATPAPAFLAGVLWPVVVVGGLPDREHVSPGGVLR